jgi:sugar phosphate isomerase/epimerase
MPKISIGSWAFGIYAEQPLSFEVVLDRIAELGFDGVDFGAFSPHPDPESVSTTNERGALAEKFRSRGLEVAAVATDFRETSFLASDDASAYLDAVDRNLRFCTDIGAGRLIVNTCDPPEKPYEVGVEVASERLLRTWREASRRAGEAGVQLTWEFEPCWAFNEPLQIVEFAQELAGPGFGVLFDTAHAHAVSELGARHVGGPKPLAGGQLELLDLLSGTINHVHLLDSDGTIHDHPDPTEQTTVHLPFGRGNVDFDRVIPALVEAGGLVEWWAVDLCFWPDAWAETAASKAYVDRLSASYAG